VLSQAGIAVSTMDSRPRNLAKAIEIEAPRLVRGGPTEPFASIKTCVAMYPCAPMVEEGNR